VNHLVTARQVQGEDGRTRKATHDPHPIRSRANHDLSLAAGGREALASKGAGGARCKLAAAQVAVLEAVLDAAPGACGYADQCWTLARIADQVWRRFGVERAGPGAAGRGA
jgi:hypothetical protein